MLTRIRSQPAKRRASLRARVACFKKLRCGKEKGATSRRRWKWRWGTLGGERREERRLRSPAIAGSRVVTKEAAGERRPHSIALSEPPKSPHCCDPEYGLLRSNSGANA